MVRRQRIPLNDTLRPASDTTLASFARRNPLLVVHELVRKRLQEGSKRFVASELLAQMRIVSGCYANERLHAAIERSKEGRADSITVHCEDVLARE